MKVAFLLDAEAHDAQYYWRVHTPITYLHKFMDVNVLKLGDDIAEDTDLVILPKTVVQTEYKDEFLEWAQELRDNGTKLVYDVDDDIFSADYVSHMVAIYSQGSPEDVRLIAYLLREFERKRVEHKWVASQCDFITVSSKPLGQYVASEMLKPVYYIPNAIQGSKFPDSVIRDLRHVVIGWAGGARPMSDIRPILDAWEIIAQRYDYVKFVISGWHPMLDGYKHWVPKSEYKGWKSVSDYASNYEFDISCVSVTDNKFSSRKSPIKAWEGALAGSLVIGSNTLYNTEPVITCQDVQDWVNSLSYYIENSGERYELSRAYKQHVRAFHDISFEWWNWFVAYRDMLNIQNIPEDIVKVNKYDSAKV